MIAELARYIAAVLVVAGALFSLLASIGLLRLPDLYTRLHAASKAGVVGSGLILVAVAVASLELPVALRALLGVAFLLLSTPVAAHLLARAAWLAGDKPVDKTSIDDLNKPAP
jgi:multicomponent Na+:H+ antiporter subunit G